MAAVMDYNSRAWCYSWYSAHFFGDPAQILRIGNYNHPVTISDETPNDKATDVSVDTATLSVMLTDYNADTFDWSIETTPDIGSSSGIGHPDGVKSCSVSNLTYDTTYKWYVNATDGNSWTRAVYQFTTRPSYLPSPPSSFSADPIDKTSIDLAWSHADHSDKVYIRYLHQAILLIEIQAYIYAIPLAALT